LISLTRSVAVAVSPLYVWYSESSIARRVSFHSK
jgi:hypothetical protein